VAAWRSKSGRIVIESFFRFDWFFFERTKLRRARRGRNLYQFELSLLQFSTEHGQMLSVAIACGWFLEVFSYCPFTVHFRPKSGYIRWNGLKQPKRLTARIDSKHAGLALTV
jgi:hypothetical protein